MGSEADTKLDPTEYVPVMRHHLAQVMRALDSAWVVSGALDVIELRRGGRPDGTPSKLTRELSRNVDILAGYLGLKDNGTLSDI